MPKIILMGELSLAEKAHRAIEASLDLYHRERDTRLEHAWIDTASLTPATVGAVLSDATGVWCAPGSPYASAAGALLAIRHARETGMTFLGTCDGFQHGIMEFSKSVLRLPAEHQELAPHSPSPLIVKLSSALFGSCETIIATRTSRFAEILGAGTSVEALTCTYGINETLTCLFRGSDFEFVAHDEKGQVRAFRVKNHPFFVGTLFQPERKALEGTLHPVVRAFFNAASGSP